MGEYSIIFRDSNANGDGRVYPDSFEVRQFDVNSSDTEAIWEVWDVTGWNGFETCADQFVARFAFEQDAINFCKTKVIWSDLFKVMRAAVNMLDKSAGSFAQLKAAVDWRDRR